MIASLRRMAPGVVAACTALASLSFSAARAGWRTFGPPEGLAGLEVQAILEDRSDVLWFGTKSGVSRYDGVNWQTIVAGSQIPGNGVTAIAQDGNGDLWFGTSGQGASRFDGQSWHLYSADSLGSLTVRAMLVDRSGRLWVGTDAGVSSRGSGSWQSFPIGSFPVAAIAQDSLGNLWFGTSGGGVCRRDTTGTCTPFSTFTHSLHDNWVASLHTDRTGAVWVGTDNGGVSRYADGTWTTFLSAGNLPLANVTAIEEDATGNLWLGSEGGVSRFDGRSWKNYRHTDGLVSNIVSTLRFDRSGGVWVGTGAGVSRYDRVAWSDFTDGGLATGVQSVFEDSTGAVWFGTSGGVVRYDRTTFTTWPAGMPGQGPAGASVHAITSDSTGAIWFGTDRGATRFDNTSWVDFDTTSGLAGEDVHALARGRDGSLWLGTATGLSRFDGSKWESFRAASSPLLDDYVFCLMVDRSGRLWVGTPRGVSQYDRGVWTSYTVQNSGLRDSLIVSIMEDQAGRIWFGSIHKGLDMFDGSWHAYPAAVDGLAGNWVSSIIEDRFGVIWAAAYQVGVSRFDGVNWHTFKLGDDPFVPATQVVLEDHSGDIWFGTALGAVLHEPDRVPPQTVISPSPPLLSASRLQTLHFAAAFLETEGIEFSYALDGSSWPQPWSREAFVVVPSLSDGVHEFKVKARDALLQEDPRPAVVRFEVDATPPAPVLSSPAFGEAVRDSIAIRGRADDTRFMSYQVLARPQGAATWGPPDAFVLGGGTSRVPDGILAGWNTRCCPDGDYELRLSVSDTLGLTGLATITVRVDNQAPSANQTSPARVSAASGGDVYTMHGETHLYFPPHAFAEDAIVTINPVQPPQAPDTLSDGAVLIRADSIAWGGAQLLTPGTLDLSYTGHAPVAPQTLALYGSTDGGGWSRLGGTVDGATGRISATLTKPGAYGLYITPANPGGLGALSAVVLTPRVFSPRGGYASQDIAIGFSLGRGGDVFVRVFNHAGRLVREVLEGQALGPGQNLVRWDGRDGGGRVVEDGLYLVTVQALGERQTKALVVVK